MPLAACGRLGFEAGPDDGPDDGAPGGDSAIDAGRSSDAGPDAAAPARGDADAGFAPRPDSGPQDGTMPWDSSSSPEAAAPFEAATVDSARDAVPLSDATLAAADAPLVTMPEGGPTDATVREAAPTFTIGGVLSGLASTSTVVLQDNGGATLELAASGPFTFAVPVADGDAYSVAVLTQPTMPTQVCTVAMAAGTVKSADVTDVAVTCATQSYSVGGTLTGLGADASVTLQDQGGNPIVLSSNGAFSFGAPLESGTMYAVTVASQPPMQSCAVSAGAGVVTSSNVTSIVVNCEAETYTVGGTVSGLAAGDSILLENDGADDQFVASNGSFAFSAPLATGQPYSVTIFAQPATPVAETCTVAGGTGTVGTAAVSSVAIHCSALTSCFAILQAQPSASDGLYAITVGQTAYQVYCDMHDGGFTQVLDQDLSVAPSYQATTAWLSGVNTGAPNSGQYSILNEIPSLKSGPNYDFIIVWPSGPSGGTVQWTQVENPLTAPQLPTVTNLVETPPDQSGCAAFRGLATSAYGQPAALHGDSAYTGCWFWAIGSSASWGQGIPSYQSPAPGDGTPRAQLYER